MKTETLGEVHTDKLFSKFVPKPQDHPNPVPKMNAVKKSQQKNAKVIPIAKK